MSEAAADYGFLNGIGFDSKTRRAMFANRVYEDLPKAVEAMKNMV